MTYEEMKNRIAAIDAFKKEVAWLEPLKAGDIKNVELEIDTCDGRRTQRYLPFADLPAETVEAIKLSIKLSAENRIKLIETEIAELEGATVVTSDAGEKFVWGRAAEKGATL